MAKMMIPLGRSKAYDRGKAETDFQAPYVFELAGPYGGHFHFWVPLDCNSNYAKELAKKMQRQRDVATYSWDYDPNWKPMVPEGVLILDNENEDTDYILKAGARSVWITVGDISVYVLKTPDGVEVAMYPHHNENADPIAVAWAPYPGEGGS
jgi:hypothetical protein